MFRGIQPQVAQARNMSIGRASALLRNIQVWEKTYRFCNLRKWKDFNKKNNLPYLKFVLRLSCVVHGPIYAVLWVFM